MPDQSNNSWKKWLTPHAYMPLRAWDSLGSILLNVFVIALLFVYLLPVVFMLFTSVVESDQLGDKNAPIYPSRQVRFPYNGRDLLVYNVPTEEGIRQLALVKGWRTSMEFIDPKNPDAGTFTMQGNWRSLKGVYRFHMTFDNFFLLLRSIKFPHMMRNTIMLALITEIGVLISSIIVAYGFSRFPLPGGNILFYILIATILIPDKVTLIPTYFFFARILHWNGTWLPLVLPFFFGSAVYIFLLRQNFRSIPRDLDEAAMLDGAGPLRILFSVILPQSWPVVITVSLIHLFYIWNETRQASLYLSTRQDLVPLSFGVQNYQALTIGGAQNLTQASALLVLIVPVIVLIISQKFFMQDMVITGMER